MAGITALNKMLRQRAAFGGIMGRDGRRQYGGGSDFGQVADSKDKSNKGLSGSSKGGYQGGRKGGYGDSERDGPTTTNPYDKGKENFKKIREEQKQKVIDNLKAAEISRFKPNKALNYLPFIGSARNIFGTPFTKAGKTRMAKRRMEYINSLPPEQRRAMIERLGFAEDEEYDELDEFALNQAGMVPFNKEDVDPTFGRYGNVGTDYTLTSNPLSYVGENPIYGMNAYDIINYDGEYLKKYGHKPTLGTGPDSQTFYIPTDDNDGDGDGDNDGDGDDYRFGDNLYDSADVTRGSYIFNQGGRVPRNMGGIMNAVPRQGYFLGKIVKGVGKVLGGVADAAGKVLKSDLGRYAIMAAGMYYGGGGASAFKNKSFMEGLKTMGGNFFSKSNPLLFNADKTLSLGKLAGISTIAPYLFGQAKPNEDIGMTDRGGSLIDPLTGKEAKPAEMRASLNEALENAGGDPDKIAAIQNAYAFLIPDQRLGTYLPYETYGVKDGGRIRAQEGGLMNLGGMEKDYRAEGGFVPIGKAEKADDVPARLSVNEFVFTADAVRNAGGGDIDKGAKVMENMMKNLENGGRVSEESQGKGNTGAKEMFSVSERIGEVI